MIARFPVGLLITSAALFLLAACAPSPAAPTQPKTTASQPTAAPAAPTTAPSTAAPAPTKQAEQKQLEKVDYPTKPITLQVPVAAGGTNDLVARAYAQVAEKKLGQSIVVVNKPGAGTQIGVTELAHATGDGYYIGVFIQPQVSTIILDPERKATFDLSNFTPIGNTQQDPGMIWLHKDSPYKTLKDLIDDAKKNPNKIRAATTGILSDDHLALLLFEQLTGTKFRAVHLEGGTGELKGILSGEVDVAFDNVGFVSPQVRTGDVRALAVMDKKRSRFVPDVPTTVELGYPQLVSASSRGLAGPKGLPSPILQKLEAVTKETLADKWFQDQLEKFGVDPAPIVGDDYRKYVNDIHEEARKLMEVALKK